MKEDRYNTLKDSYLAKMGHTIGEAFCGVSEMILSIFPAKDRGSYYNEVYNPQEKSKINSLENEVKETGEDVK